jgi:preprotein translocase subunit SecY
MRLTLAGAIYITAGLPAAGIPDPEVERAVLLRRHQLLIIVVVTMDFMSQVQAYVMSHQYESLLKKANFKGAGFPAAENVQGRRN